MGGATDVRAHTEDLQTVRDRVRGMSKDLNDTLESVQQFINAIMTQRSSTQQLKTYLTETRQQRSARLGDASIRSSSAQNFAEFKSSSLPVDGYKLRNGLFLTDTMAA